MIKSEYIYLLENNGITISMFYEVFCDKNPKVRITAREYQQKANDKFNKILAMPRGEEKLILFKEAIRKYLDKKFDVKRIYDNNGTLLLTY